MAALRCLPAGLQSEFTATVETSVGPQREREREEAASEGAVWDFFSSTDARAGSLSNPEGPLKSAHWLIAVSGRPGEGNADRV